VRHEAELHVTTSSPTSGHSSVNPRSTPTRPGTGVKPFGSSSDRDGNDELYVMDPDGPSQTNLTGNPADDVASA
jgi:hypothetical protein